MKKTKRTLLCLMLAVLMVASCAMTAMAASGSSEVVSGNTKYPYKWSITCGATYGTAYVATTETPATVRADAYNFLYSAVNKAYGNSGHSDVTGYSSVTASPNNILVIKGVNVPSEIKETHATFYVAGKHAATTSAAA